ELAGMHPADVRARERLGPRGALVDAGLVEVDGDDRPFLTRALRVPDRVTAHLLGGDTPDLVVADLIVTPVDVEVGDDGVLGRLGALATEHDDDATGDRPPLVYVIEPAGASGRSYAAAALARADGATLVADLDRLGRPDPAGLGATVRALGRE